MLQLVQKHIFLHLLRVLLGVQTLGTPIAAKETFIIIEGPGMGLYQNKEELDKALEENSIADGEEKKHPPRGGSFQNYRSAKKFIKVACFSKKDYMCWKL